MTDLRSADTAFPYRSATEWLRLLHTRQIGAVELLELQQRRVAALNPQFNLVVAQDPEAALELARAADQHHEPAGLLHGLPMTIKDTWEVTGMPTTCGFPFLARHRAAADADAVARLKAAGAIVFGKTNVPTGAADHQSANPVYGISNNPWNPAHTVGGSSGGAAGALAAGFTALELGSDIGGSIRCPSHFCGVYGHKPSHGIVPIRGHIPPMPGGLSAVELAVGGPLARSAFDLSLAMRVLVAPAWPDDTAWRIHLPAPRHERLADFRVALWLDAPGFALDDSYRSALLAYADDLRRAGVQVVDGAAAVAGEIDATASHALYIGMLFAIIGAGMPPPDVAAVCAAGVGAEADSYAARLASAVAMDHRGFAHLLEQRAQLMLAWQRVFATVDVVLCPVMPTAAYAHDHSHVERGPTAQLFRHVTVSGQPRPYLDGLQWPGLATVAHLPATAMPIGRRAAGLPLGVQAIGPHLEDRTTLRFAELAEQALGGFVAPF